jgi:hypothetical protein
MAAALASAGKGGSSSYSSAPLKIIKEIQFGLFSPEEVKNMSVAHILYPETMVSPFPHH